jgi:hypothetical protein
VRWSLFPILIGTFGAIFPGASAWAETAPCPSLFQSDPELFASLPERFKSLFGGSRRMRFMSRNAEVWEPYFGYLDQVASGDHGGQTYSGHAGSLDFQVKALLRSDRTLEITFAYVGTKGLELGESAASGVEFFNLLAAHLDWIARNRTRFGLRSFEFVGEDLRNLELVDSLRNMGFKRDVFSLRNCGAYGLGGITAGAVTGTFVGIAIDGKNDDGENHPGPNGKVAPVAWSAGGGAVASFAVSCFVGKKYFDYRLELLK